MSDKRITAMRMFPIRPIDKVVISIPVKIGDRVDLRDIREENSGDIGGGPR